MDFKLPVRRVGVALAIALLLAAGQASFAPVARAADASAPLLTIAKSALLGGLVGLVLGSVTALVVESDKRDDSIRWGIVIGTFGGFAYGIYAVSQDSGDDFFGVRAEGKSGAWRRPLPGADRLAPFAGLAEARSSRSARRTPDPFRTRNSELTPIAWTSGD